MTDKRIPGIPELIEITRTIEGKDLLGLASSSEAIIFLLTTGGVVFDKFGYADQVLAHAILIGEMFAEATLGTSPYEVENNVIITVEERIALLNNMILASYRASLEASKHPDCPKPKTGGWQ